MGETCLKVLPGSPTEQIYRNYVFVQTFDGIDNCGKRLATELRECVEAHPELKYISVIGHSMGGLIARHAIGALFAFAEVLPLFMGSLKTGYCCNLICSSHSKVVLQAVKLLESLQLQALQVLQACKCHQY